MSFDNMCSSQNSKTTDIIEFSNEWDLDNSIEPKLKRLGEKQKSEGPIRKQTNQPVESALKRSIVTPSPSKSPCSSSNYIPFYNTFGKAEKLVTKKSHKLRLSLDSQKSIHRQHSPIGKRPLRRRARSSEGFMLKKNASDFFEANSLFEERSASPNEVGLSSLSPFWIKPQVSRRKNVDSKSQKHGVLKHMNHTTGKVEKERHRSVIPLEHPLKIGWDVLTVVLSVVHTYLTHTAIRDRRFEPSPFISFCQAWFLVDILLNFFTERKTNTGEVISDPRRIVARYLTSWFVVDILSLFPWEVLYVKPLIEVQNRRGFFKKSFFRSRAVVRVTTHLRGRHFRWFGTVAKHTKHHGIGAQRLLRLIIKYVPKYVMFLRNMKGVVAVRILRFVHWSRRSMKNIESGPAISPNQIIGEPGEPSKKCLNNNGTSEAPQGKRFKIGYDWDDMADDDDGIPM